MKRGRAVLALGIVLLAAEAAPLFAQCAMCAQTVANSEEGRALSSHLNSAILLLLVAPYAVFGTFAAVLFRRRLRALLLRLLPGHLPSRLLPRWLAPPTSVG